jgi:hypothetical protein
MEPLRRYGRQSNVSEIQTGMRGPPPSLGDRLQQGMQRVVEMMAVPSASDTSLPGRPSV